MAMVCLMSIVSSCGPKYYDFVQSEFPQSPDMPNRRLVAQKYRRSALVLDEFITLAIFDALWLSDAMRTAYVDVYSNKRGLDCEAKEAMLRRQLEENKYWFSMYVLADIRDKTYVSLSDPASLWDMSLQIDDNKKILPESIKEVDLEPEFQSFFETRFNYFKTAYLVKFPITTDSADKITKGLFKEAKLIIKSTKKETTMVWNWEKIKNTTKVIKGFDADWIDL